MLILTLHNDDSPENPSECDGWKVYSFSRRHASFKDPDTFFPPSIGLRRKLAVGTAHVLSYYEHSGCAWSLKGEGPSCPWDSVGTAGILVWEDPVGNLGPKTLEARTEDARRFVETYTRWCNGECYGYSIDEEITLPCGHTERRHVDSCFGFMEPDYMASEVRAIVDGRECRIEGEAKDLASYHDFTSKKAA